MEFKEWGRQYLTEAQVIKQRIDLLKGQLKTVRGKEERNLLYRINMLYDIYLELRHTGEYLIKAGRRD